MSLLEADLAQIIGDAFSSGDMQFLPATRYRPPLKYGAGGDVTETVEEMDCRAIVDQIGEYMRVQLGWTELTQRLLILGTSLAPNGASPADLTSDDSVEIHSGPYAGIRFSIASTSIDPAGAVVTAKGVAS